MIRFIFAVLIAAPSFAASVGYYRFPTIHDDQIVFVSEGDLWQVSTAGGPAHRITSHPALEAYPHFSPDGKTLAFTADYEGNSDVYTMPAGGGPPTRLTFFPVREDCIGWTPDGKSVMFRSRRNGLDSQSTTYLVPTTGGEPSKLNVGVCEAASFSPDGKRIAINPFVWNGTWKRYRGGTAPKIWVGPSPSPRMAIRGLSETDAPREDHFQKITNDDAVDQTPMWIGERIYFLSERTFPTNLWSCKPDGSDARQETHHTDFDARFADSDGKSVVYTHDADVWVFDVKSGQTKKIDVTLPSDRIRQLPHTEDANKTFESFDLSADGKRVIVSARGELWNAPAKPGGRIIDLTRNDSGTRERQPAISPDGKSVACITDQTGEQELALLNADGKGEAKILTHRSQGWIFSPIWSADSRHLAYSDETSTLMIVDPKTGETKAVDQDKNWELTEYIFSPDSRWLAYTKLGENHNNSIWLYELSSGKTTQITTGFTSDSSPAWDPKGKYLYFLSQRVFRPELDDLDTDFLITQSAKPCVVMLAKDGKSPLLPEEVLAEDEKPATSPATAESSTKPATTAATSAPTTKANTEWIRALFTPTGDDADKKEAIKPIVIDLDGIQKRVVEVPVDRDNCSNLLAIENKLFWVTTPTHAMGEGEEKTPGDSLSAIQTYDFDKRKAEQFVDGVNRYVISHDGKKIAYKKGEDIQIVGTDAKPSGDTEEKVAVSKLPLTVDPVAEWKQIYAEAWRLQRDFFWAPNMVGLDWPAMRKKYEPLLDRIATRGELTDVIGQLIGELGNSHTYVFGGETNFNPPPDVPIGVLGAEIEFDPKFQHHRFTKVYRPEAWETETIAPLTMSNARVQAGDLLLAINGVDLKPSDNVDQKLINLADVQVQLTVCNDDQTDKRDIQIKTLKDDEELRYADWCRENREFVDRVTDGKVGYLHLPDMSDAGLIRFVEGFYPQTEKDALIIDERGNHGGFVSQMIIEKLARKAWAFDTPRRGLGSSYPSRVLLGYKCVILNEHAGSDGDIFPDSFRTLDLGPLIGKRTWGGVIGIRTDKGFIDNGMSSQPEFAWWDAKRGWAIENHGVDPDIEVDYTPMDWIAGKDPQLQRAIDEMLAKIKAHPVERPEHPAFPNRAPTTQK